MERYFSSDSEESEEYNVYCQPSKGEDQERSPSRPLIDSELSFRRSEPSSSITEPARTERSETSEIHIAGVSSNLLDRAQHDVELHKNSASR